MGAVEQSRVDAEQAMHKPGYPLRVEAVIEETADARSFVLAVPDELVERFRYRPGQFLTFRVEQGGKTLTRCYSLASSPDCGERHKVTVKRVDGGRVSNWFNDQVRPGDTLQVLPPAGHFHLSEGEGPVLLFGGGSGITPVLSILKSVLVTSQRKVKLVYANRDETSVIFRDELRQLQQQHAERLELVHVLESVQGYLLPEMVGHLSSGYTGGEFFICGPGPFMDTVERALLALGEEPARIHVERFVSPADGEALELREQQMTEQAQAGQAEQLLVGLDGDWHPVPVAPGQTLLQSCLAAGLEAPYSCEEGFCGACMCQVEDGEVLLAHNDVLSEAERAEGWTLACQGRPVSREVKIKFPE